MKMDVQGYEMNLLRGATALLKAGAIEIIKTELAGAWLEGQGTSASILCQTLVDAGFDLFLDDGSPFAVNQCEARAHPGQGQYVDVIAKLHHGT